MSILIFVCIYKKYKSTSKYMVCQLILLKHIVSFLNKFDRINRRINNKNGR